MLRLIVLQPRLATDAFVGLYSQIIYGLPVSAARIPQLAELRSQVQEEAQQAQVRLLVDNEAQVAALSAQEADQPWSVMVKLDNGGGCVTSVQGGRVEEQS